MSLGDILRSIFEIALVVFTLWAVFNEDKFIVFEEKIVARFRRKKFKVIKGGARSLDRI